MSRTAIVNYHIHKPERQAFVLDAAGIRGNLISPELVEKKITLQDERATDTYTSFKQTSVGFAALETKVDVFNDHHIWQPTYEAELRNLLGVELDLKEAIIFDHTVRVDDEFSDRKPARHVHSDYSIEGAQQRLIDILGEDKANQWAAGHYAFINVWRPVESEINSSPLGFIRPSSVSENDWILLDLIYPDRKGQILGLVENSAHEWIYRSKMTPTEVAYFNIYDNKGQPPVAHSALEMVENPEINTVRKSIETRALVRYRDNQSESNH